MMAPPIPPPIPPASTAVSVVEDCESFEAAGEVSAADEGSLVTVGLLVLVEASVVGEAVSLVAVAVETVADDVVASVKLK